MSLMSVNNPNEQPRTGGLVLSAGLDWLGSPIPLAILTTSCLPAGASAWYRATRLVEGWDAAGMGSPRPLDGGEGAAGLRWLLDQEPGGFCGADEAGLDLVAGEDATGDQTVETNPSLVQSVVAAAFGGLGDGGQFLLERGAAVAMASCGGAERYRGNRLSWMGWG